MHYKVEGEPDLIRDETGTIQNNNQDAYRVYIARRDAATANVRRIEQLEQDTSEIKQSMSEILAILRNK